MKSAIFESIILGYFNTTIKFKTTSLYSFCVNVAAMFDMSRETDVSVNLYSRKVMIMPKANYILPRWLRFMKGEGHLWNQSTFIHKHEVMGTISTG